MTSAFAGGSKVRLFSQKSSDKLQLWDSGHKKYGMVGASTRDGGCIDVRWQMHRRGMVRASMRVGVCVDSLWPRINAGWHTHQRGMAHTSKTLLKFWLFTKKTRVKETRREKAHVRRSERQVPGAAHMPRWGGGSLQTKPVHATAPGRGAV